MSSLNAGPWGRNPEVAILDKQLEVVQSFRKKLRNSTTGSYEVTENPRGTYVPAISLRAEQGYDWDIFKAEVETAVQNTRPEIAGGDIGDIDASFDEARRTCDISISRKK